MRSAVWLALLVVAPASAAGVDLDVRPSIYIRGDAGFLDPASGVRSGSGTPEDPYVISDWTILQTGARAVLLHGTRAHAVVERIDVPMQVPWLLADVDCVRPPTACGNYVGIELLDAQNVTVRDVDIVWELEGVRVVASRDVRIEDVRMGHGLFGGLGAGVTVEASRNVTVSRIDATNLSYPVNVYGSEDVLVESSRFDASNRTLQSSGVGESRQVTIRASEFRASPINIWGAVDELRVEGNAFLGGAHAVIGADEAFGTIRFCGNRAVGTWALGALNVWSADLVVVRGNSFEDLRSAVELRYTGEIFYEGNLVRGTTPQWPGVYLEGRARLHGNAFEDVPGGVTLRGATDARHNWWGHPTGPSGEGAGEGVRLHADPDVPFDPWLDVAPAVAGGCH